MERKTKVEVFEVDPRDPMDLAKKIADYAFSAFLMGCSEVTGMTTIHDQNGQEYVLAAFRKKAD